jgi:hypothetical protein
MAVIGEVAVNIVARTNKFLSGMKKSERAVKRFSKTTKQSMSIVTKALRGLSVVAGVGGVAGLTVAFNNIRQSLDQLGKTADKLGIATEQLQGLRFAAEKAGVASNTLDMALQRATRRISEAAQGTGEAKAAIKELGLDAKTLAGIPLDRQMRVIADAFQKVGSQSDRVRLAFKLFDSEGVNLVNVLKDGSDGLDRMQKRFEELGGAATRDAIAQVERFNDAMTELRTFFGGVGQRLVIDIAPAATQAVEGLILVMENQNRRRGFVGQVGSAALGAFRGGANALNFALGNTTEDRVRRQLQSGIATGTPFDAATVERFNRQRNRRNAPGGATDFQREAAKQGLLLNRTGFVNKITDRAVLAFSRGREARRDRITQALGSGIGSFVDFKNRAVAFSEKTIADNRRKERRFEELTGLQDRQTPSQQQGINRLIEATSAEGQAAIRKGRRPNERLEKLSKAQLEELKQLRKDLNKPEPLQSIP